MVEQCERNVISGKPPLTVPNIPFGQYTLDKLRQNPIGIVQVDVQNGQILTNKDLLVKSVKLATALDEKGVKVGDTIAISAENHINWYIAACATIFTGATLTAMNPRYSKGELLHCLNISKPKIIFVSRRSEASVRQIIETLSWAMEIIELDDTPLSQEIPSLKNILEQPRSWPDPYNYEPAFIERPDKETLVILYSSGTTGLPKGVMLSHHNVLIEQFVMADPESTNLGQNDTILLVLPFFHGYGFSMLLSAIHAGATAIVPMSFELEIFLDAIEKYKVTMLFAVPPMMNLFAKSPIVPRYDYSSLKEIFCGAAPLSPEISRKALNRMGNPILRVGYGMTELSMVASLTARHTKEPESIGHLMPGLSCKIIDLKTSKSLGSGKIGEMCFRGEQVMLGYKNDPKATNEIIDQNGWLHSGDIGYYDQDGDLFCVGRLKELIKYKGFQVSPSEMEAILLTHPEIADGAVIGKPDENAGEIPMAFVVLRPNSKLTADQIRQYVDERVAPHSRLRGGVHFLKAIPKNVTGKILRQELSKFVSKI